VLVLTMIFGLLVFEFCQRNKEHTMDIRTWPTVLRWAVYLAAVFCILVYGEFSKDQFIYFQF